MKIYHVILDRDGVLNREPSQGWVVSPQEWAWERGALEGLAALARAGVQVSVATNQSCIGRGLASVGAVDALHEWMVAAAAARTARIERVLVCPHVDDDDCGCRKPKAGLLLEAVRLSGLAPEHTLVVGDSRRDLIAGRTANLRTALVRTGKGVAEEPRCSDVSDWVFDDLAHAAQCITGVRAFPTH